MPPEASCNESEADRLPLSSPLAGADGAGGSAAERRRCSAVGLVRLMYGGFRRECDGAIDGIVIRGTDWNFVTGFIRRNS